MEHPISYGQPPGLQQDRLLLKKKQYFGAILINKLLWFFIPSLIFACIYSYYMAVKQKQEKPFPGTSITATACHYPQDILFRYLMLSAGGFINLIYFTIFRWLLKKKQMIEYPYGVEQWMLPLAQASVIGFYFAIATIDEGGVTPIHAPGAGFFFCLLFLVVAVVTYLLRQMRQWFPYVISRESYYVKLGLVVYLLGVIIFCGVGVLLEIFPRNETDDYSNTIEWNLTLVSIVWLLTFVYDFGGLYVSLRGEYSLLKINASQ